MLSKKTQYGFKALSFIGRQQDAKPILISNISKEQNIPIKFLEFILLELKKAHILDSKKGRGGGYFFKVAPNTIPLSKIIRLLDGPIALIPCVSLNFFKKCDDCLEKDCKLKQVFSLVRDATLKELESKTVQDLC